MTKKEISLAFSNGEFEKLYPLIAEDAVWIVVEENQFVSKEAVVANCKQVHAYFNSVTTHFETHHVIGEDNKVVVNGTAEFLRGNTQLSIVSACDLYEFNEKGLLEKITSYCIPQQKT